MKKLITMLLVLAMALSLVSMNALAIKIPEGTELQQGKPDLSIPTTPTPDIVTPNGTPVLVKKDRVHDLNDHEYGYASNTKYHWLQCACGCKLNIESHVDPKDATDDYCFCGYHFSDNADLVTLWVNGCPPIKNFNKNTTEYKLKAHTYKDVKEIKISTRTFDSEATVELPEDLTLKAGENKFDVKVISENQKVPRLIP